MRYSFAQSLFEIAEKGAKRAGGFVQVKEVLGKVVDRIDTLFESDSPVTGLSTGFTDFDMQTSGLQPADLVIVAGRPSMGKTTFAMNLAENAAIKSKQPVAVIVTGTGSLKPEALVISRTPPPVIITDSKRISDLEKKLGLTCTGLESQKGYIKPEIIVDYLWASLKVKKLLLEGGGKIVGEFLKYDMIDYLYLTIYPQFFGNNNSVSIADATINTPKHFELINMQSTSNIIFLKYSRRPS